MVDEESSQSRKFQTIGGEREGGNVGKISDEEPDEDPETARRTRSKSLERAGSAGRA